MKLLKSNNYIYVAQIEHSEIEKIDFHLCTGAGTGGRQTLEKFYEQNSEKPQLAINGGFFNMANGETAFVLKSNGQLIMDYGKAEYYYGIGTINNKIQYGYYTSFPFDNFITAYPPLIENGAPANSAHLGYKDSAVNGIARRTAIGYNKNYIYVVCVDEPGLTLRQLQNLFIELKCDYAVNLDGGGSTRMLYEGKTYCTSILGNRPIDNIVAFYLKDKKEINTPSIAEPKVIYRVQVGAYKSKTNANNMLTKIHAAGYTDAYIKLINGLYKVQIGAFSIKANADRLLDDLKSKGFNGFIAK